LDVISSNPRLFLTGWLETLRQFPGELEKMMPSAILGSIGLFIWLARPDWRKLVLLTISLGLTVITCLVWLEARFLLPFLPLLAILITQTIFTIPAGDGKGAFPHWFDRFIRIFPWRQVASVILIGLSILPLKDLAKQFEDQAQEYQAAIAWINKNKQDTTSIFAAKPHIAYFSNSKYYYFRDYDLEDKQLEDLPAILAEVNPTYMIFDQRYAGGQFPQYQVLLDPAQNPYPDILKPVHIIETPFKLVIYAYTPP
jgi:hypothetical protein